MRKPGSSLKQQPELYRRRSSFNMSTIRTVKIKEVVEGMGYIYKSEYNMENIYNTRVSTEWRTQYKSEYNMENIYNTRVST